MMKVKMILTNRFDPDVRVLKEARYIKSLGHDVEILCWDRENEYKDRPLEDYEGIRIRRFFPYAKYGTGFKQIVSMVRFTQEIKKYLKNQTVDILHAHDLDAMTIGSFCKTKAVRIFDMHEYYLGREKKGLKKKVVEFFLDRMYKKADGIIYVNEKQIETMPQEYLKKLLYLPNYPECKDYPNTEKTKSDKIRLGYIGSVRQYEQLMHVIKAAQGKNFEIMISGSGVDYDKLKIEESKYANLSVTGRFSYPEINDLYRSADVLLVIYDVKNKNAMNAWPVKFFESILTLTPMIVTEGSIIAPYVKNHEIGFVVNTESEAELERFLAKLEQQPEILKTMRENLKKIQYDFSWDQVVKNLDRWYQCS